MENNPLIVGLRESGITVTAQRIAICRWLYDKHTHPTAAEVHGALQDLFPTMSLATVYNTLNLLEQHNLIYFVDLNLDGIKRYDVHSRRHINFVCKFCGKIIDVYDETLMNTVKKAMELHSLNLQEIVAHGICLDCAASDLPKNTVSST
jgi:Fur family transcriptional regulator, peroxide stress response regulator